jgi:hypothetical protein
VKIDPHILMIIFALLAVLLVLLIVRTLKRWNADPGNPIAIRDLLMENGKLSKGACVMMGAFAVTTWFILYYSLQGKMSEGYLGLYLAAWVTPVVARLIVNAPTTPPAAAVTTTTTTTEMKA